MTAQAERYNGKIDFQTKLNDDTGNFVLNAIVSAKGFSPKIFKDLKTGIEYDWSMCKIGEIRNDEYDYDSDIYLNFSTIEELQKMKITIKHEFKKYIEDMRERARNVEKEQETYDYGFQK